MPTAGPLTAATTGLGIAPDRRDDRVVALGQDLADVGAPVAVVVLAAAMSLRSAPEEKARPGPGQAARRAPRRRRRRRAPRRAGRGRTAAFQAFSASGRLSSMRAAAPSRRTSTVSDMGPEPTADPAASGRGRIRSLGWSMAVPSSASAPRSSARAGASGTRRRVLLPREYADAIQRAGGLALLLPPDPVLVAGPRRAARRASTGSSSPAAPTSTRPPTAPSRTPRRPAVVPERDRFELALDGAARSSSTCPSSASAAGCRS